MSYESVEEPIQVCVGERLFFLSEDEARALYHQIGKALSSAGMVRFMEKAFKNASADRVVVNSNGGGELEPSRSHLVA